MKKGLAVLLIVLSITSFAQTKQNNIAQNAFVIYRMAEKLHIQPKPMNEQFSDQLFQLLLKKIDPKRNIFFASEIEQFQKFRYQLHTEIIEKKTLFLQTLTTLYTQHLEQIDTLVENILKHPFNFSTAEKYTIAEDTNFVLNIQQQKQKWTKQFKLSMLFILSNYADSINRMKPAQQKIFSDSIENGFRKKFLSKIKSGIKIKLQGPGGIQQYLGNLYCNMIAETYDPHSSFMNVSDKENFESDLGRNAPSFGFSLNENANGEILIDNLMKGSSAFKSGLLNKGDKIVSIQWENEKPIDVAEASMEEVIKVLELSNHAKATLTVVKPDGTKREIALLKEVQENDDANEEMVKSFILKGEKKIGYIILPSFYIDWQNNTNINGCANDVAKEIVKLKKENIEGLIIDVRYNGGGSVGEAVELSGIFIDAGPISLFKLREPKPITLKDVSRGTIYDGPIIVLVNGYSASASELFAAAMQDYRRALIVGSSTYGKATRQQIFPLDSTISLEKEYKNANADNYLKLTVSQVFRVNGKTAQFTGVTPDVLLPDATSIATKEKNESAALLPTTIEANKYYQPLTAFDIEPYKQLAVNEISNNAFFKNLNDYLLLKAESKKNKTDYQLKYSEFLQQIANKKFKNFNDEIETEEAADKTTLFTIDNTAMENQLQKSNIALKEINDLYKEHLLKDVYLKICYAIMQKMIK